MQDHDTSPWLVRCLARNVAYITIMRETHCLYIITEQNPDSRDGGSVCSRQVSMRFADRRMRDVSQSSCDAMVRNTAVLRSARQAGVCVCVRGGLRTRRCVLQRPPRSR
jgi:hypothetical protein